VVLEASQELKEVNRLYKELDDIYHDISLRLGISDSVLIILYSIVEMGDGCIQKDISEKFSISRQTINSAIKKLQSQGYITLKQGKGRDMHIYLTPDGKKYAEDIVGPVMELENSVFKEMSPEESREFLRLTQKYVSLFQEKVKQIK
jgi:DNA-binding MarR family transcriptional regulator